jgi:hypothetical protein
LGYVINGKGEKLEVSNSDGWCGENTVLISDTTVLLTKYILNIFKHQIYQRNSESEFVKEIIFDEEPNDEMIIFHMVQNGVNRYSGYAYVEKIKVLDFGD